MVQAYQAREFEQQDFKKKLLEGICALQEADAISFRTGDADTFYLVFATELITIINAERGYESPSLKSVAEILRERVQNFSRTPAEKRKLLGEIAVKLLTVGLSDVVREYQHQQVHNQEILYGGHRATDEVDFLTQSGGR
jgi:hypothetical protein